MSKGVLHRNCFPANSAFARKEILMIVAALSALALVAFGFVFRSKKSARLASCQGNLKEIGVAMSVYTQQNGGRIPFGSIHYDNKHQVSWDTLLESSFSPEIREAGQDTKPPFKKRNPVLRCPSDPLELVDSWATNGPYSRRSYSMSKHSMRPENWPPGPDNNTGLGLNWSFGAQGNKPPGDNIYNFTDTNQQAAVTVAMITDPRATLLITEQVNARNVAGMGFGSVISRTFDHLPTNIIAAGFQQSRINYLMVDGHVENLPPQSTVGTKGEAGEHIARHHGMWTIKSGD